MATAYAPYAAQAYLKADINSPVTVIRLLGVQGDDASDAGHAGWEANVAFGLFAAPTASAAVTASLVGIIYGTADSLKVGVEGTMANDPGNPSITNNFASSSGEDGVKAVKISNDAFTVAITDGSTTVRKKVSLREGSSYIRDRLNTNPVATNSEISTVIAGTLNEKYWL